jgi:hypothetical protein
VGGVSAHDWLGATRTFSLDGQPVVVDALPVVPAHRCGRCKGTGRVWIHGLHHRYGKTSYVSEGCPRCASTGVFGQVPDESCVVVDIRRGLAYTYDTPRQRGWVYYRRLS